MLIDRSFFQRDVVEVARQLLGMLLVREDERGRQSGIIVEVEAYLGAQDPAAHSYRGPTPRNASMFGPVGHAYVYTIHTHFCMNVVAGVPGEATAVLLRALEPVEGIEHMRARRHVRALRDLTSGPGKLCAALAIDRSFDGWDLTLGQQLWLEPGPRLPPWKTAVTPRIGIRLAADLPLRFFIDGNPFVSGPRRQHSTLLRPFISYECESLPKGRSSPH